MVPGEDTVHVDVPEELGQIPKQCPMLQVLRGSQVDHKVPETWHSVGNPRLPHFQEEHWGRFPALGISMVKSQQVCLALTEWRRQTAHSHNEQGAREAPGTIDPSSVPRISHGPENAHDGNISHESLLVLHSVKKNNYAFKNLDDSKGDTRLSLGSLTIFTISQALFLLKWFIVQPGGVKSRYRLRNKYVLLRCTFIL